MKKKLLTKVSNIEDISVSVEYFKDKYFPDILKETELLKSVVNQIKLEPRILYDENYVKGWKDDLTIERESKIKIIINLLQSILNELENSNTVSSYKKNFDRWTKAKEWLNDIFSAASSGSRSKLIYFGPCGENLPSDSKLSSEFKSLKNKLERFFLKHHPVLVEANEKKKQGPVLLSKYANTILIDEVLGAFAKTYQKSYAPYSGLIAAKERHEVDTIDKIVLHILANKYRTTFQSISVRMKLI